jgi:hypothetical protein
LVLSYWIDYFGFITEEKLVAMLITPSLGVPNWSVIYIINTAPSPPSSSPREMKSPEVTLDGDGHGEPDKDSLESCPSPSKISETAKPASLSSCSSRRTQKQLLEKPADGPAADKPHGSALV